MLVLFTNMQPNLNHLQLSVLNSQYCLPAAKLIFKPIRSVKGHRQKQEEIYTIQIPDYWQNDNCANSRY